MVKTILRLAGEHEKLSFVTDQRGHPTVAADLARMLCLFARRATRRALGTSRTRARSSGTSSRKPSSPPPATTRAASDRSRPPSSQPPRPAPRPANSVLDNRALRDAGIALLPDFHESARPARRPTPRIAGSASRDEPSIEHAARRRSLEDRRHRLRVHATANKSTVDRFDLRKPPRPRRRATSISAARFAGAAVVELGIACRRQHRAARAARAAAEAGRARARSGTRSPRLPS